MGKGCVKTLQRKGKWSEAEELTLATLHRDMGNRWASISKHLPERTDSDVKNHWFSTLRSKSDAKMQTFLWIYAKKVESVSESPEARESVFNEVMSNLMTLSSSEVLTMAAGLNKPACSECHVAVKEEKHLTQGMRPATNSAADDSFCTAVDSHEVNYICGNNESADPSLLNGDISDDLMLKLIESSSEDEWFSPYSPHDMVSEPIWAQGTDHSDSYLKRDSMGTMQSLVMKEEGTSSESLSEGLPLSRKRMSPDSPSQDGSCLAVPEEEWYRPMRIHVDRSNEQRADVVNSACPLDASESRGASSNPLCLDSMTVICNSADTVVEPSTELKPRIMYTLLMEHIKRQQMLGSSESSQNPADAVQQQLHSTATAPGGLMVAELQKPVHMPRRRCLSHPFCSRKASQLQLSSSCHDSAINVVTKSSCVGTVDGLGNKSSKAMRGNEDTSLAAMYSVNSHTTLEDESNPSGSMWVFKAQPLQGAGNDLLDADPMDLLFESNTNMFSTDNTMETVMSLPEWIM